MRQDPAPTTATRVPRRITLTSEEVGSSLASLTGSLKEGMSRAERPPACVTVLRTRHAHAAPKGRDRDMPSLHSLQSVPSTDSSWGKKPETQLQLAANRLHRKRRARAAGAELRLRAPAWAGQMHETPGPQSVSIWDWDRGSRNKSCLLVLKRYTCQFYCKVIQVSHFLHL